MTLIVCKKGRPTFPCALQASSGNGFPGRSSSTNLNREAVLQSTAIARRSCPHAYHAGHRRELTRADQVFEPDDKEVVWHRCGKGSDDAIGEATNDTHGPELRWRHHCLSRPALISTLRC